MSILTIINNYILVGSFIVAVFTELSQMDVFSTYILYTNVNYV